MHRQFSGIPNTNQSERSRSKPSTSNGAKGTTLRSEKSDEKISEKSTEKKSTSTLNKGKVQNNTNQPSSSRSAAAGNNLQDPSCESVYSAKKRRTRRLYLQNLIFTTQATNIAARPKNRRKRRLPKATRRLNRFKHRRRRKSIQAMILSPKRKRIIRSPGSESTSHSDSASNCRSACDDNASDYVPEFDSSDDVFVTNERKRKAKNFKKSAKAIDKSFQAAFGIDQKPKKKPSPKVESAKKRKVTFEEESPKKKVAAGKLEIDIL